MMMHIAKINQAIQFKATMTEMTKVPTEQPFLDGLIRENADNSLDTTANRNPTNAGRSLNFHYCHWSATKQGLMKRAEL